MSAGGPAAMFVHAHPDDETITTGGTLAACVAAGLDTRVVTCTLGEEGEVLGEEFQGLVADRADQLGGYRIGELSRALRVLGLDGPRFLGGAGRWRDSGMAGTPAAEHPRAFVSSGDAAVEALVAELDAQRPDLVVTYDPEGGYGHPDHIRAHRVTMAAITACAHPPRRLAWTVTAESALAGPYAEPGGHLRPPHPGELPSVPDSRLTHGVRLEPAVYSAKLHALAEHATQLELVCTEGGDRWYLALTNGVLQPVPREEWYVAFDLDPVSGVRRRCAPGAADLFEGLGDRS